MLYDIWASIPLNFVSNLSFSYAKAKIANHIWAFIALIANPCPPDPPNPS